MTLIPGFALAHFAAVLCFAAPTALCKLPGLCFPFTAPCVGALADALPCIVLAAGISHDDTGPVLDFQWMHVAMCELFDNGKDVGSGFGVE